MATQAPLIPSLYALIPSSLHSTLNAQLSLLSIHAEPFKIQDDIFVSKGSIPGERTLRLRTQYPGSGSGSSSRAPLSSAPENLDSGAAKGEGTSNGKGKEKANEGGLADPSGPAVEERYSLAYVSQALSGREYGEMNVRAVQGMDVAGLSSKEEVWEFIEALGLRHSHSYTRSGVLFYIPLPHPTLTLRLTITRVAPADPPSHIVSSDPINGGTASTKDPGLPLAASSSPTTPYLVQLSPSRSVQAVPQRGEPSLGDVMRMMREVAGRVDMLDWGTGRE